MEKIIEKKSFLWLKIVIVVSLFITGGLLYSRFLGTSGLIVKEQKITSSTLPKSFHGLKIVHMSDIHYGTTIKKKDLEKVVKEINLLKPDIVFLTGDLFDRNTNVDSKELTSILSKIDVSIKKYAILGNHDYTHKEWKQVIENSGFINFNDTYELVYNKGYEPIMIAGISSNMEGLNIEDKTITITKYLESLKNKDENKNKVVPKYKILILHEPDFIDKIDKNAYDLILAGHSHNGQVRLPFIGATILPNGSKKYYKEFYQLNNTSLYISSGLGTSTIKFRFLNKPSINFYRLMTK